MHRGAVQPFPVSEEYVKNTEIKPENIAKFRQWVQTQPHLPNEHISDLDLILTYHCCERSPEVAKQVLDLNLTLRTMSPIFGARNIDDKGLERAYHTTLLSILPERSPEGYAVLYTCLVDCDPKKFILRDVTKALLMTLDLYQLEEGTWPGLLIAMDMRGVQFAHLSCLDIQIVQHFLYYLQEAFLAILKGIHILNAPPFMDKLLMIVKPFMKKQLLDIMHIHQANSKIVEKFIPIAALPKQSGGDYKDINSWLEELWQKVKANQDYFAAEGKRRVTESKRPGRPKHITDIFGGIEGSFKKLDID